MAEHLFDLGELTGPIATIKVDPRCQHITVHNENEILGAFVDLGCELHWWSSYALHLDVAGARELADALNAWADRHDNKDDQ